jgi:hypothetical protein
VYNFFTFLFNRFLSHSLDSSFITGFHSTCSLAKFFDPSSALQIDLGALEMGFGLPRRLTFEVLSPSQGTTPVLFPLSHSSFD